jgi:hypothetical protein
MISHRIERVCIALHGTASWVDLVLSALYIHRQQWTGRLEACTHVLIGSGVGRHSLYQYLYVHLFYLFI